MPAASEKRCEDAAAVDVNGLVLHDGVGHDKFTFSPSPTDIHPLRAPISSAAGPGFGSVGRNFGAPEVTPTSAKNRVVEKLAVAGAGVIDKE